MNLNLRFRAFALVFAIWQAASLPVAAWVDAILQQSATATQAQYGREHAEEQGTHHAWTHHGHECALCTVIAAGMQVANAASPFTAIAEQFFPAHLAVAGPHHGAQRRQSLPRAPPSIA